MTNKNSNKSIRIKDQLVLTDAANKAGFSIKWMIGEEPHLHGQRDRVDSAVLSRGEDTVTIKRLNDSEHTFYKAVTSTGMGDRVDFEGGSHMPALIDAVNAAIAFADTTADAVPTKGNELSYPYTDKNKIGLYPVKENLFPHRFEHNGGN